MALTEDEITRFLAGRHHAVLGINRKHASPHLTPVWYLWNGRTFEISTTRPTQKVVSLQRDPRVSISITDPDQPYIYAEFRGVVERIEEDPTGAFYNTLSDHYKSPSRYRGDPRVILYIKIQHVVGQNL